MANLNILQYPDPRLQRKGYNVSDVRVPEIQKIIDDMLETLANTENCAALAATQLNIESPPNIVVINGLEEADKMFCLINPQIVDKEGREIAEEGCMSVFPDHVRFKVERAKKILVTAISVDAKPVRFKAEGFMARCIQHECDHLNGILYLDYLSREERILLEEKMVEQRLLDAPVCI